MTDHGQSELALIVARLRGYLRAIDQRHPRVWQGIALARKQANAKPPDWCYLPLADARAVASASGDLAPEQFSEIAVIGGLAGWRLTKGIYLFDQTLLRALWDTPISPNGDLPADIFLQLPEWCVYVPTPNQQLSPAVPLLGFFAHADFDAETHEAHLRVLLDTGRPGHHLISLGLHLAHDRVSQCIAAFFDAAGQEAVRHQHLTALHAELATLRPLAESVLPSILSVAAYLTIARQSNELHAASGADRWPSRPRETRTKHGLRIFAAPEATVWSVGYRIGPALRAASETHEYVERAGWTIDQRHSPRGHIRRAHWHTYWTGPRNDPVRQTPVVKWLPPTRINLGLGDEVPVATVYPVRGPA